MKKNLFLILFILFLLPTMVMAKTQVLNLKETLAAEEINANLSNYKETDDQVTIYLFRGQNCPHCEDFLNYLSSIVSENGQYFKLRSYETYNNKDNKNLLDEVGKYLGYDVTSKQFGIPFIIIGKKSFVGFGDSRGPEILSAIKEEYENSERYDVLSEVEKENAQNTVVTSSNTSTIVLLTALFVTIGTIVIVVFEYIKFKKINLRLDDIERKVRMSK